ncbi:MAG: DNA primase [Acidobacteria bacterium]|nr:MAG: DNA primase [Acidobacteriota bacterium]
MALGNIHLTPQLVQAVRDAVDIVDIAGDHTKLRKAGRRHTGLCPLHKEKTPSFSVDSAQGLFYCFGCGQGGDAIKLHMMLSGDDFPAAIETLAKRYGIPLPQRPARHAGGREEPDLEAVLEAAAEYFQTQLKKHKGPEAYLRRRKISPDTVERFGLGYAPEGWRHLVEALHPRFPMAELEAAGLVARSEKDETRPYDRFRHRLMFPIRTAAGRLVGFGGRTLGDDRAKYINTQETDQFRKGYLLYGLDTAKRAIRDAGSALLVEGYFDVLGAVESGIEWTVASMGTALTESQAKVLRRHSEEVVVGYDGDEAGEKAFRRSLTLLLAQGLGVRRALFGSGQDPDSLRLEAGPEAVVKAVEEAPDGVMLELDRLIPDRGLLDPQAKSRAARAATEILSPIPDGVLRYSYSRQVADRLGVPVELLWRRLARDGERAEEAAKEPVRSRSLVRSLEEMVLQLLLAGDEPLPAAKDLPTAEVFLDKECRNIYQAFYDLYRGGDEQRPEVRLVHSGLEGNSAEVDLLARLLLEEPSESRAEELEGALQQLERRWLQQRLRALASEISRAQQDGDSERLDSLLKEKTEISRALHSRP